jgi:DNA-binding NarL/FixJ family response regulator
MRLLIRGKMGEPSRRCVRTVAYHKHRMMEVLGAKSNAELVKYAVRNHVVAA